MKRRPLTAPLPHGAHIVLECGHSACNRAPADDDSAMLECTDCDLRRIPTSTHAGRRTPTFNQSSTPPALLNDHRTSAWAELVVSAGSVEFHEDSWSTTATPDNSVVIVPDRFHHIRPDAAAEFHVQFHDLPSAQT